MKRESSRRAAEYMGGFAINKGKTLRNSAPLRENKERGESGQRSLADSKKPRAASGLRGCEKVCDNGSYGQVVRGLLQILSMGIHAVWRLSAVITFIHSPRISRGRRPVSSK